MQSCRPGRRARLGRRRIQPAGAWLLSAEVLGLAATVPGTTSLKGALGRIAP